MILNICDMPNVMEVLRIVNIVIKIIRIVVPIILMVSAMFDLVRAVTNAELNKMSKTMVSKVIAAILVFLIPTFVSVIALIAGNNGEYKHCLEPISLDQIKIAYTEFENDLVEKAEETFDINDYSNAMVYLMNVKDPEKRKEFEERLKVVKEQIDIINQQKFNPGGGSGYPSQTYGKCDFVQKSAGGMTYGLCVPEQYTNQSIPMIVWLHGSGEVGASFNALKGSGLLQVVRTWDQTGLQDIPAIIVAPQLKNGTWSYGYAQTGVKAIMDEVMSQYNINKNNVSLIGHSLGGSGVYQIASAHQSYFTSIVMLSGYVSSPSSSTMEYFKNIPMRGYSEGGSAWSNTSSFFRAIGKSDQVRKMNCGHGQVPRQAMILDENNDKISDLVYWMLSNGGASSTVDDQGQSGTPQTDGGKTPDCNKNGKYQSCSPKRGVFGSFPYYDSNPGSTSNRNSLEMDPAWRKANFTTVSKTCSNGKKMNWTVHVKAKTIWQQVQEKICQITTTGIDGIVYDKDEIIFSGPTVVRFVSNSKSNSNHAYGTAIDVNPSNKYTIDGKTYQPYGRNIKQYESFVSALGKENDTRNINYVLWVKIFKPLGFNWGRYWSGSSYDGMHFEIDYKRAK